MKLLSTGLIALLAFAKSAAPAPQSFDMTDPKGVSGLRFHIDSTFEPIFGQTSAISGNVMFDEGNPSKSTGKIVLKTSELRLASEPMTEAMQGEWCLDPKRYPEITFEVKTISDVKPNENGSLNCMVTGDLTLHGVTKSVQAKTNVRKLVDKLRERGGVEGKNGDLLVVRSSFKIERKDFNLAKELTTDLLGPTIEVEIATVGVSIK